MATKRQHPSVLFQNGEVRDFHKAMYTYIAQFEEELRIGREIVQEYPSSDPAKDRKELEEQRQGLEQIKQSVQKARSIYREIVEDAETRAKAQAAAKMRETGDSALREIADALESGDYSRLAL